MGMPNGNWWVIVASQYTLSLGLDMKHGLGVMLALDFHETGFVIPKSTEAAWPCLKELLHLVWIQKMGKLHQISLQQSFLKATTWQFEAPLR